MSLTQAWLNWFSGTKLSEDTMVCFLWCWKLLVWARWAKVVQFIAAVTIVADIIGVERLHKFGNSLNSIFSTDLAKRYLVETFRWLKIKWLDRVLGLMLNNSLPTEDAFKFDRDMTTIPMNYKKSFFDRLNIVLSLVLLVILWLPFGRNVGLSILQ